MNSKLRPHFLFQIPKLEQIFQASQEFKTSAWFRAEEVDGGDSDSIPTYFIGLDKLCISLKPQILHVYDKKVEIENITLHLYTIKQFADYFKC